MRSRIGTLILVCSFWVLTLCGTAGASEVPELDPGTAASGLALLAGGLLLLLERRRRR